MSEWFVAQGDASSAPSRVFCFPFAGGSPGSFAEWQADLLHEAEVVAMCPPGRGHRLTEPRQPITELIESAAAAIAAAAERDRRPIVLFGHSLGGLVAFEVARRLRHLPMLRHLVASGISAPSLLPSERMRRLAGLEGSAFVDELAFFGGLPREVLEDRDVLDLLLPGLIADFRMAVEYCYRPAAPLALPVSLIAGRADPHVGRVQLWGWDKECAVPPKRYFPDGGHFYFQRRRYAATGLLKKILQADQASERN